MTRATAFFLTQLREFLNGQPASKRRELKKLHEKLADGKKVHSVALSRHLNLQRTPLMDTAIVYLRFAQQNGIIESTPAESGLFRYVSEKDRGNPQGKPAKRPKGAAHP